MILSILSIELIIPLQKDSNTRVKKIEKNGESM